MTQPAAAPDPQTLDQLQSLEERILHVLQLLNEARQARQHAEEQLAQLRAENSERDAELAALRQQATDGQHEREEVRRRVEKLLRQVETMGAE